MKTKSFFVLHQTYLEKHSSSWSSSQICVFMVGQKNVFLPPKNGTTPNQLLGRKPASNGCCRDLVTNIYLSQLLIGFVSPHVFGWAVCAADWCPSCHLLHDLFGLCWWCAEPALEAQAPSSYHGFSATAHGLLHKLWQYCHSGAQTLQSTAWDAFRSG